MTKPEAIRSTALSFVVAGLILMIITFIAGFGHDLRRMEGRAG